MADRLKTLSSNGVEDPTIHVKAPFGPILLQLHQLQWRRVSMRLCL